MHLIRFLISYVTVTILGLMMLLFLALNRQTVQLDLIDGQRAVSLAWVMAGAAVVGFVIALLILLPGRAASALINRRLKRDLRELEQQFEQLDEMRERLLAQQGSLLERHEQLVLRYLHLETHDRETSAALDRARRQLAAPSASGAAQPATSPATRVGGIGTALRLLPPTAPPPIAPASSAPASAARAAEQSPATPPAAHAAGERVRDVRPAQLAPPAPPAPPAPQQQPVPRPTAPSAFQGNVTPASAPVTAAPGHEQAAVGPVASASPASSASPTPAAPPTNAQPTDQSHTPQASRKSKKPLVTRSALRRPVESVLTGVRHEWQRAEVLDERLRSRITVLRVRVEAQINALLAQLKRRNASGDIITRNEQSQTSEFTSHDADD
ncbi:MAG TPA: LapA family protein [Ktedonobacterales bacterium]|nr:LapA family protein [Ktedonobacterales bacterium]